MKVENPYFTAQIIWQQMRDNPEIHIEQQ